jgi:hypothetical protein
MLIKDTADVWFLCVCEYGTWLARAVLLFGGRLNDKNIYKQFDILIFNILSF